MFVSIGQPLDQINWQVTSYTNNNPVFSAGEWTIEYKKQWCIFFNGNIIACALSFARSPCTVFQGEWYFLNNNFEFVPNKDFFFDIYTKSNSKNNPFNLIDIGNDYFVRIHSSKPIWYIDPSTNKVEHSGAKTGKRYCWKCQKSFSGNNFVYQHLKFHKRHSYRKNNYSDFLDAMISENL